MAIDLDYLTVEEKAGYAALRRVAAAARALYSMSDDIWELPHKYVEGLLDALCALDASCPIPELSWERFSQDDSANDYREEQEAIEAHAEARRQLDQEWADNRQRANDLLLRNRALDASPDACDVGYIWVANPDGSWPDPPVGVTTVGSSHPFFMDEEVDAEPEFDIEEALSELIIYANRTCFQWLQGPSETALATAHLAERNRVRAAIVAAWGRR